MPWFQRLCEKIGEGYVLFSKNEKDDEETKVKCTMISYLQDASGQGKIFPDKTYRGSIKDFLAPSVDGSFGFDSFVCGPDYRIISFMSRYKDEYFAGFDCKKSSGDLRMELESQTLIFKKTCLGMAVTTMCSRFFHELHLAEKLVDHPSSQPPSNLLSKEVEELKECATMSEFTDNHSVVQLVGALKSHTFL